MLWIELVTNISGLNAQSNFRAGGRNLDVCESAGA